MPVTLKGLRETRRKLRDIPKDSQDGVRAANNRIASVVADAARRRVVALGHQGPAVGASLKVGTGLTPSITLGGSRRVGSRRAPVYKLMYGTEFGSNSYPQFHAA